MFRITAETCHEFTFAEILILAAMNVEASIASEAASMDATEKGPFTVRDRFCG